MHQSAGRASSLPISGSRLSQCGLNVLLNPSRGKECGSGQRLLKNFTVQIAGQSKPAILARNRRIAPTREASSLHTAGDADSAITLISEDATFAVSSRPTMVLTYDRTPNLPIRSRGIGFTPSWRAV